MQDLQAPDYLRTRARSITADSVQGMGGLPVPYVSIEGNSFTLVDAAGTEMPVPTMGPIFTVYDPNTGQTYAQQGSPAGHYLDAVFMDSNPQMSKAYYSDAYNPNAQRYLPPSCWSDNGIGPSRNASKPVSLRCDLCPMNVWGSKINQLGNQVKACDDMRKFALYVPALFPMKTIFLLRLKGSSHKNWRAYADSVSKNSIHGRPMEVSDLITRIYYDPEHPVGILKFTAVGMIDQPTAMLQDELWQTNGADQLLGKDDRPIQQMIAGPTAQAPAAIAASPQPSFQPPPAPPAAQQTWQPQPAAPSPPPTQQWQQAPAAPAQPAYAPAPSPPPTQGWAPPTQPAAPAGGFAPPSGGAPPAEAPKRRKRGSQAQPAQPQTQQGQWPAPNAAPPAQQQGQWPSSPTAQPQPEQAPPAQPSRQAMPAVPPSAVPDPGPLPSFLVRKPPDTAGNPQERFGMQAPAAPTAEVTAAIHGALNIPSTPPPR